jgi:hypothetical protein
MANIFKPTEYNNHLDLPITINSVIDHIAVLRAVFNQIEAIQKEEVALMIQCNKSQRGMTSNPEINEYYDYQLGDKLRAIEFNFYRINRVSSILSMYAYLETSMFRICQQKQKSFDIPSSVSELSDSGIVRSKNYLKKFDLIDFSDPTCNGVWSNLIILNKLRNALAHSEGDIELTECIKTKTINKTNGLSLVGTTIMISDDYVLKRLDNIQTFLIYLCQD